MMPGSRSVLLGLALVFSFPFASCQSGAPRRGAPGGEPVRDVYRLVYGDELGAWVFDPGRGGQHRPAILLFHGGGWSDGSPEWTFKAAERFRDHGMVAVAVEYRLSKGSVTPVDAILDACAAFRWARENAARLRIDPERVAGYGVSAGAHLVASTATVGCAEDSGAENESQPNLLLLWSPALDVTRDAWFGKMLQRQGDAREYSPAETVRETTPPTSIVIGERDTLTPLAGSRRFCERLVASGTECELNVYEGVGHLLTRNLANQESNFDPDPALVAEGIDAHLAFLARHGFIEE